MKSTVLALVILVSSLAHADLNQLCEKINQWTPGQAGPAAEEYKGEMSLVDADFVKSHQNQKDWLLVDARGDKERSEKGAFDKVLSLRSGLKEGDADDYSEKTMIEKIQAHTNAKKMTSKDLKKFHYMFFCNGEKCPKGARAACKVRKMGVAADHVHIVPLSYEQLKEKGL